MKEEEIWDLLLNSHGACGGISGDIGETRLALSGQVLNWGAGTVGVIKKLFLLFMYLFEIFHNRRVVVLFL